jgi:hypothetical protein
VYIIIIKLNYVKPDGVSKAFRATKRLSFDSMIHNVFSIIYTQCYTVILVQHNIIIYFINIEPKARCALFPLLAIGV